MPRVNKTKQDLKQSERMAFAISELKKLGVQCTVAHGGKIEISTDSGKIIFWPYTGWHHGENIEPGRGIARLLSILKWKKFLNC